MVEEGDKAPNFKLKDKDGNVHSLDTLKSKYRVVFFYPKDNTPGCTIEANKFNGALGELGKLKAAVIGISGGDEKTKEKFCSKNKLVFPLVSDPDFAVSTKYGVYGEKSFMGKKYMGISRYTFIVDDKKKVIKKYTKVKPLSHVKEVIEFLQSLE